MEGELIKVPKDLLEELASEYQAKISWFMDDIKSLQDMNDKINQLSTSLSSQISELIK
ncbi:hypothetical protein [Providencia rettgeri]|uniref:hypothetical protein n=1 Tax=Providencia rettgeri TaxID=587 RepID=UPI001E5115F6|nr:hypothetical protein LMY39_14400 [Providencia rettgeri]